MHVSSSPISKQFTQRRKPVQIAAPTVDPRAVQACRLDRNADLLLALNCHITAERLSLRAQALREARASA